MSPNTSPEGSGRRIGGSLASKRRNKAIAPYGPVEKSPDASRGATAPSKWPSTYILLAVQRHSGVRDRADPWNPGTRAASRAV